MVTIEPIMIKGHFFTAVVVQLPKTTLLTISNDTGYIMCGALDVGLLNSRLVDRKIIAGRAVGKCQDRQESDNKIRKCGEAEFTINANNDCYCHNSRTNFS